MAPDAAGRTDDRTPAHCHLFPVPCRTATSGQASTRRANPEQARRACRQARHVTRKTEFHLLCPFLSSRLQVTLHSA
jgi:hypothetical protein